MKKEVVIFEKDRQSLEFLREFFKGHPLYSAVFLTDAGEVKKRLKERPPEVLMAGSPQCLDKIPRASASCPVLALVSPGNPASMRSVIERDIEHYIFSPIHKDDLEYKLAVTSRRRTCLEDLYLDIKDLEAIVELTYLISSTLDPQEVLYLVVKKLDDIMEVSRCSMLSANPASGRYAKVVSSCEAPSIRNLKLDLEKYPEIRKALKTNRTVIVRDAMKDPLMNEVRGKIMPLGIKSILVIPVVFRDEVIGTLFLRTSRKKQSFTEREIKLCQNIARASANALSNAFLFEKVKTEKSKLQKLAITDFLTGVFNIRYFYHRLEDEFSRAQRYGTPLSCMMFDIDHFKKINDTYGHRTGDMVLREFAKLVKKHTRKSDTFARYGGEEFILLLPNTSLKGALAEGNRLSEVITGHKFKGMKGKYFMTVSIGIASVPSGNVKTQDELISRADDALLEAKEKGRNLIVVRD
jgi:two-component system cell cycle response regulator